MIKLTRLYIFIAEEYQHSYKNGLFLILDNVVCFQVYLQKIEKRIKEYKINILNAPRHNKHLLVLDIDYTLFDHRSAAETGEDPHSSLFYPSSRQDKTRSLEENVRLRACAFFRTPAPFVL